MTADLRVFTQPVLKAAAGGTEKQARISLYVLLHARQNIVTT